MATSDTDQKAPPLWQFVTVADHYLPTASVGAISKNWFATWRKRLRPNDANSEFTNKINNLKALPCERLQQVAPAPDWRDAVASLDGALEGWLTDERSDRFMVFLIGPPHGGCADILRRWAEQHQWRVLDPPAPEQILSGDPAWPGSPMADDRPWVLPCLERIYLRHATGLGLVRHFLQQACRSALGRGIIGCDSWAWAFLRRIWPPGRRALALTLQSFDQERLTVYFQRLAGIPERQLLLFRQSNNGAYVLPPPAGIFDEPVTRSDFLRRLAAHSRGIPGVARAIWRASLRTRPATDMTGETGTDDRNPPCKTIWIAPWDQIEKPALPGNAGRDQAFVLHALLLHGGLTVELLGCVLPLAPHHVVETLALLQDAGLVEQAGEVWRVTPIGYPAVRGFLEDNRYFSDDF